MLNGVQYVEAARVLGERAYAEAKGDAARMVEIVFLRGLSRKPDAKEREIAIQLYHEQKTYFTAHPDEAKQLLKVGCALRRQDSARRSCRRCHAGPSAFEP